MGSKIAGVVFLFFTIWGMASVIELQYWRNADTYPVWLTKHLRISPENNEKSLIRIGMETFDKVCGDNRGLLAVTQKQNGMFMRCDDSPGFFSWFSGVYKVSVGLSICYPHGYPPLLWIINILCLRQLLFLPYVVSLISPRTA